MPQGLQIFDSSGVLEVDITTSLTRVVGSVYTGGAPGSAYDGRLLGGRPFFYTTGVMRWGQDVSPVVTISGGTISWTFPAYGYGSSIAQPATIFYGIY